jgi:hypothetical protein
VCPSTRQTRQIRLYDFFVREIRQSDPLPLHPGQFSTLNDPANDNFEMKDIFCPLHFPISFSANRCMIITIAMKEVKLQERL